MTEPLSPETQALLDEVTALIEKDLQKFIGEIPENPWKLFEDTVKDSLRGRIPTDVFDSIQMKAGVTKDSVVPANFYTALIMGCATLDIRPLPAPAVVKGDSWTCEQGTFTWRDEKLFFAPPLPIENIDITFTV